MMEKLTPILFMIAVSQLALGQAADESEIEEIIVIGELSRSAVRFQIINVETDIYNFYNANNGNEKLNIVCREVALTGTRIPQRVCEPVFLTEARNREVADFVSGFTALAELESPGEVKKETDEMNVVFAELIGKFPSFAEAVLILEDLKAHLEELGG